MAPRQPVKHGHQSPFRWGANPNEIEHHIKGSGRVYNSVFYERYMLENFTPLEPNPEAAKAAVERAAETMKEVELQCQK